MATESVGFSGADGPRRPGRPGRALRWKLKPGETLHYVMEQKTETSEKAGAQEIKSTLSQTTGMSWAIRDVQSDGVANVVYTIDWIRSRFDSPFGTFAYDSKDPKEPQGLIAATLVPLFKALIGARFTFKMSPQGVLSDVKVPEELTRALQAAGPAGGGASIFSEEGLKNMIVESSLTLPEDDRKTWTRQVKITSPFGTTTLDKTYTNQGPDPTAANVVKIELVTKVDLPPQPEGGIPFKVKEQERKGTFDFDTAAGRVIRSEVTERLETVTTINNVEVVRRNTATTSMHLEPTGAAGP